MALTKETISLDVTIPDDTEFASAELHFTLSEADADTLGGVTIPPQTAVAPLDASGQGSVDLWPVDRGTKGAYYVVKLYGVISGKEETREYKLGRIQPLNGEGPYTLASLLTAGAAIVLPAYYSVITDVEYAEILAIANMAVDAETLSPGSSATSAYSDGLLTLGIPEGKVGPPGGSIDPDAYAYITATTDIFTNTQMNLTNATVLRLRLAKIWNKVDVLNIDFGAGESSALVNMKNPTQVATNNGATYVAGQGFTGDGVADWIDTGLAAADMPNFTQDSASLGVWVSSGGASSGRDIGFSSSAAAYITSRTPSNLLAARANDTVAINEPVTVATGLSGVNRSGSAAREIYKDGVKVDNDTQASTAPGSGNLSPLRGNTVYSDRTVSAWWAGGSLSESEWSALYDILEDARNGTILVPPHPDQDYVNRSTAQAVSSASGVLSVSMDSGHIVNTTMDEDITTVTVTDWPTGVSQLRFFFLQDATGDWEVTWPAAWKLEQSGPAPQPSPVIGYNSEIVATSLDGGTTVRLAAGGVWNG